MCIRDSLLPIAFGMLLTNLPGAGIYHAELFEGGHVHWEMFEEGVKLANGSTEAAGLLDVLYLEMCIRDSLP